MIKDLFEQTFSTNLLSLTKRIGVFGLNLRCVSCLFFLVRIFWLHKGLFESTDKSYTFTKPLIVTRAKTVDE